MTISTPARASREQTLFRLVHRVGRAHLAEMIQGIHERGFPDVPSSYPALMANLDTDGTRLVALAARAGVTRQAAGQLVDEIERKGYVERRPDPADGRGVVVMFTPRGRKLLSAAFETVTAIDAKYERIVGAKRYAALKKTLAELAQAIDEGGELGE